MIKPFEIIQSLDRVVNNIKYQFKFSKNKKESESIVKELTKARNDFNTILNNTFQSDALETLILELVITKIKLEYKSDDARVYDLELYLSQLSQIVKDGKDVKASELISVLKLPYEKMMTKDFDEKQDLLRVQKMMEKVPTNDSFLKIIQEFMDILKTDICLTKK